MVTHLDEKSISVLDQLISEKQKAKTIPRKILDFIFINLKNKIISNEELKQVLKRNNLHFSNEELLLCLESLENKNLIELEKNIGNYDVLYFVTKITYDGLHYKELIENSQVINGEKNIVVHNSKNTQILFAENSSDIELLTNNYFSELPPELVSEFRQLFTTLDSSQKKDWLDTLKTFLELGGSIKLLIDLFKSFL